MTALALLDRWLDRQARASGLSWYLAERARLAEAVHLVDLAMAFGRIPRHLGKAELELPPEDLQEATQSCPGWQPAGWTVDEAARIALLLSLDPQRLPDLVAPLAACAELGELVALLKGLPLYPGPERFLPLAGAGVRSSLTVAFQAVAHRNPFPARHFSEPAWNQLVLKAVFIGIALDPIDHLDQRANPTLARMLIDYARERRAASRPVSPELWRPVGRFIAEGPDLDLLTSLLTSPRPLERRAARLALAACPLPAAQASLAAAGSDPGDSWSALASTGE